MECNNLSSRNPSHILNAFATAINSRESNESKGIFSFFKGHRYEYIVLTSDGAKATPSREGIASFPEITQLVKGVLNSSNEEIDKEKKLLLIDQFKIIKDNYAKKKLNIFTRIFYPRFSAQHKIEKEANIKEAEKMLAHYANESKSESEINVPSERMSAAVQPFEPDRRAIEDEMNVLMDNHLKLDVFEEKAEEYGETPLTTITNEEDLAAINELNSMLASMETELHKEGDNALKSVTESSSDDLEDLLKDIEQDAAQLDKDLAEIEKNGQIDKLNKQMAESTPEDINEEDDEEPITMDLNRDSSSAIELEFLEDIEKLEAEFKEISSGKTALFEIAPGHEKPINSPESNLNDLIDESRKLGA